MQVIFAFSLVYLGCFSFYHADPRRTGFDVLRQPSGMRVWLRVAAWILLGLSLLVLVNLLGWARGIPSWLGLLTLAGIVSLLIAAVDTQRHVMTGVVSVLILITSGIVLSMGAL